MQPIKCRIEHPVDGTALLTVADLSAGGLCLLDASQQLDPAPGTVLEECLLLLPEQATLSMDLTVRNSFLVTQNDGSQARRIGCAFKALSADKSAILQRFIHRIQVEQLAKSDV
jgi:c-di-GMP-binding flagellar brake protein YcgR